MWAFGVYSCIYNKANDTVAYYKKAAVGGGYFTVNNGSETREVSKNQASGGPGTYAVKIVSGHGYDFRGWVGSWSGKETTRYFTITDATGDMDSGSAYAIWEPSKYTITLDHQGGKDKYERISIQKTATFNQALPTIQNIPTKNGYALDGWYDKKSDGKKYYNADGTSAADWDKTKAATLYAHWIKKSIYIENADKNKGKLYLYAASDTERKTALAEQSSGIISYDGTVGTSYVLVCKQGAKAHLERHRYYGAGIKVGESWKYRADYYDSQSADLSPKANYTSSTTFTLESGGLDGTFVYEERPKIQIAIAYNVLRDARVEFSRSVSDTEGKWYCGPIDITIRPQDGRKIASYSIGGVGGDVPEEDQTSEVNVQGYILPLSGSVTISGEFTKEQFVFKAEVDVASASAISSATVNGNASATVNYGDEVTFAASAATGYAFAGWFDAQGRSATPPSSENLFDVNAWGSSGSNAIATANPGESTISVSGGNVVIDAKVPNVRSSFGASGGDEYFYTIRVDGGQTYVLFYSAAVETGQTLNAQMDIVCIDGYGDLMTLNPAGVGDAKFCVKLLGANSLFTVPDGCDLVQFVFRNNAANTTATFSNIVFRKAVTTANLTLTAKASAPVTASIVYPEGAEGEQDASVTLTGLDANGRAVLGSKVGYRVDPGSWYLDYWSETDEDASPLPEMGGIGNITVTEPRTLYAILSSTEPTKAITVVAVDASGDEISGVGITFTGDGEASGNTYTMSGWGEVAMTAPGSVENLAIKGWFYEATGGSPISASARLTITLMAPSMTVYVRYGEKGSVPVSVGYTSDSDRSMGTVSIDGGVTQAEQGTEVTFRAVATNGYVFDGWYDVATGYVKTLDTPMNPEYTFTVIAKTDLYARFKKTNFSVFEWEGADSNKMMRWRSKVYVSTRPFSPSACRVDVSLPAGEVAVAEADGGGVTCAALRIEMYSSPDQVPRTDDEEEVSANGRRGAVELEEVGAYKARRIPVVRAERYMAIEVRNNNEVDAVIVGTSMGGLAQ